MQVWSHAGSSFAFATAGSVYNGSWYKEYLAYALADRPLYKPGETVGLTIFLRSREGGPSAPMAGKPVHLIISDPQGKQALDQTITTNQFGSATVSVPLAKNATLGAWSIRLTSNEYNYRLQNAVFRVEEYKPPEYTVSVEPVAVGRPGEPVRAKIKASFYSGGPVANAVAAHLRPVEEHRRSERRRGERRGGRLVPQPPLQPVGLPDARPAHPALQDGRRRHRRDLDARSRRVDGLRLVRVLAAGAGHRRLAPRDPGHGQREGLARAVLPRRAHRPRHLPTG
jgi:hypothetical protein